VPQHFKTTLADSLADLPRSVSVANMTVQIKEKSKAKKSSKQAAALAPVAKAPKTETAPQTSKAPKAKPIVKLLAFDKRVELRRVHLTAYNEMRRLQRSGENAKRLSELQTWLKENGHLYSEQELADPALRAAAK
jgi:hypothetical protein